MTAGGIALLAFWALAGAAAGWVYFRAVWASAQSLAAGGGRGRALGLAALRFALLAALLGLAVRSGAGPLLAASLGLLVARAAAMRRMGRPAP